MAGGDTVDTGENLGSIFQILQGADKAAQQDSPYAPALGILAEGAKATDPLARNPYTGQLISSPGMAAVSGLANGLMRGMGMGLQNQYVGGQDQQARQLLMQGVQGQDLSKTQMPDGMNPSVFNAITGGTSILNAERQMQSAMMYRDVAKTLLSDPEKLLIAQQTGNIPPQVAQFLPGVSTTPQNGTASATGSSGSNVFDTIFQNSKEGAAFRAKSADTAPTQQSKDANTGKVSDEFTGALPNFQTIMSAAKNVAQGGNTTLPDQAGILAAFSQLKFPASGRPLTQGVDTEGLQGAFPELQGKIDQIINNKSSIPPATMAKITSQSIDRMNAINSTYKEKYQNGLNAVLATGGDLARYTPLKPLSPLDPYANNPIYKDAFANAPDLKTAITTLSNKGFSKSDIANAIRMLQLKIPSQ